MKEKFKSLMLDDRYFYSLVILVVAIASFGLGRATIAPGSVDVQDDVKIFNPVKAETVNLSPAAPEVSKEVTNIPEVGKASVFEAMVEEETTPVSTPVSTTQPYVASKSGTKYHLTSCPGAKQIKPENKITFATRSEAEAAGYSPAGNCPGLK